MTNDQQTNEYKVISAPQKPPEIKSFTPEWALYRYLEAWAPDVMELAIQKNYEWDLSQHVDTIINYATEQVLEWFKKYRPDLHEKLNTDEGKKWLRRNIKMAMTPK